MTREQGAPSCRGAVSNGIRQDVSRLTVASPAAAEHPEPVRASSGNRAETAIREAFDAAGQSPVEFGSSVYELRMPLRAAEALDEYGILTVGALSRCTEDELRSNTRLGAKSLEAVRAALKRVGMSLREPGQVRITEGETDESEDEEANRDCD
jgi:DNA-directed RNA polymerase alpha subunit